VSPLSRRVALFFLVKGGNRNHGGAAYVTHLCRGLRAHDLNPVVVRVSSGFKVRKTGDAGAGHFGDGVPYLNMNVEAACAFSKQYRALIAVSHFQDFVPETHALLSAGVPWVLHAQANVPEPGHALEKPMRKVPIIAIRESLRQLANKLGCDARYIPHPYQRVGTLEPHDRKEHAVVCSRIDFAKHTDVAIEANRLLPADKKIGIYGGINRMYAFHSLDKKYPEWREEHRGEFPLGRGVSIFRSAQWAVDMTYWSHDRGGTQYTFFEAWDAERPLVLHRRWFDENEPTSRAALFVDNAAELASLVGGGAPRALVASAQAHAAGLLAEHGAARVGAAYAALW